MRGAEQAGPPEDGHAPGGSEGQGGLRLSLAWIIWTRSLWIVINCLNPAFFRAKFESLVSKTRAWVCSCMLNAHGCVFTTGIEPSTPLPQEENAKMRVELDALKKMANQVQVLEEDRSVCHIH